MVTHHQKHLHSNVHQDSSVSCPFCSRKFTTASGVSHHLETGTCPNTSGMNRKSIYQFIAQRDRAGVVTNKAIGWYDDESWDTDNAYNGNYYECYICHREFNRQRDLDQHLYSPTHQQEIYHCPNGKCAKQFKTLAAMFNHLESESCGFAKFGRVNQCVDRLFASGQRQIGF